MLRTNTIASALREEGFVVVHGEKDESVSGFDLWFSYASRLRSTADGKKLSIVQQSIYTSSLLKDNFGGEIRKKPYLLPLP